MRRQLIALYTFVADIQLFLVWVLQKSLSPNLPDDLAISFYLQSHKLIFAVYQLTNIQGTMKFDSYQAECSVPWLNEVLILFTVALQLCQQLKDKVNKHSPPAHIPYTVTVDKQ